MLSSIKYRHVVRCGQCNHLFAVDEAECPYCNGTLRVKHVERPESKPMQPAFIVETPSLSPKTKRIILYCAIGLGVMAVLFLIVNNLTDRSSSSNVVVNNKDVIESIKDEVDTEELTNSTDETTEEEISSDYAEDGSFSLSGNIAGYSIKGNVFINNGNVAAQYGYRGRNYGISVNGTIDSYGSFTADEYNDQGDWCGHYDGSRYGNRIVGTFYNYKGDHYTFTWNLD